jgi:hypothetical protein
VIGTVTTAAGVTPKVSAGLKLGDVLGSWKARWGIGRMGYTVSPGLFAIGSPHAGLPVLVSANYKMSFDRLRGELAGIDAWILVLDTKGINVWCAAGKGTFGTEELVRQVNGLNLSQVVSHRLLILPQLGAPGVAAHEVQRRTGFRVVYGPVRASDLPAFLKAGNQATPGMREVHFGFLDRLVLTPMELVGAIKPARVLIALLFLLTLIRNPSYPFLRLLERTFTAFVPFLGAILSGAVLAPSVLPFIPGRAFAWKGWVVGFLWSTVYIWYVSHSIQWTGALFYMLVLPAISGYLTMNFTGASTYTSLSGVVREMRTAMGALVVSAGLGCVVLLGRATGRMLGIF